MAAVGRGNGKRGEQARGGGTATLAGVRALLLDMDGVLVARGRPIPGAADAVGRLDASGIPYRVITNTSLSTRASLARRLSGGGFAIPADRIVTALSATVTRLADRSPGARIYLIGSAEAPDEFADSGVRLLADTEIDAGAGVDAVVIGDSEDRMTFENLDRAFRQIRDGAEFIAMHRNPWWFTPAGPTLDSGAFVVGLEYATGRRAVVAGKPAPDVFRAAFADLADDVTRRGVVRDGGALRRREVAMVGDDPRTDLAPARRLGMRTALVLTGRHGREQLDGLGVRGRSWAPDLVADSIVDVVAAVIPKRR